MKNVFRRMAKYYDYIEWPLEIIRLRKIRKPLISSLKGKILEIGAGTGKNIKYYGKNVDLALTDASKDMLDIAKGRARLLGIKAKFIVMPAEKLSFRKNSFDTVIATLVLCSVDNPVKALKEMKRVCRNNGTIVLLEHIKSSDKILYKIQKIIKPGFKKYFGCNPDRDTLKSIRKSGMRPLSIKNVWLNDVFKQIIIKNKKN